MPNLKTQFGSVHYVDMGEGIPLLLLHANPGSHRDYEAIIPALAKNFRVIGLDFPGYGESPALLPPQSASAMRFADIVEEVVQQLRLDAAVVMGNSVGGYCAVQLALRQPARVQALVLVSTGGFTPSSFISKTFCRVKGSEFITGLIATRFAKAYLKHRNPFVQAIIDRTEHGRRDPQCVATDAAVWRSFTHPEHDLREVARAVHVPTLIISGQHDPVLRADVDGKIASQTIPNAQFEIMDTGHEPFAETPDAFLEIVMPFLMKVEYAPDLSTAY